MWTEVNMCTVTPAEFNNLDCTNTQAKPNPVLTSENSVSSANARVSLQQKRL